MHPLGYFRAFDNSTLNWRLDNFTVAEITTNLNLAARTILISNAGNIKRNLRDGDIRCNIAAKYGEVQFSSSSEFARRKPKENLLIMQTSAAAHRRNYPGFYESRRKALIKPAITLAIPGIGRDPYLALVIGVSEN